MVIRSLALNPATGHAEVAMDEQASQRVCIGMQVHDAVAYAG